jgi:hypothetical protein
MARYFPLMIVEMQHSLVSRPAFLQKTAAFYFSAGRSNVVHPALVTGTAQIELTILTGCGPQAVFFRSWPSSCQFIISLFSLYAFGGISGE